MEELQLYDMEESGAVSPEPVGTDMAAPKKKKAKKPKKTPAVVSPSLCMEALVSTSLWCCPLANSMEFRAS